MAALAAALKSPAPWLSPYLPIAQQIVRVAPSLSVADALNAVNQEHAAHIRFVAQTMLPDHESYEAFIRRTSCVPTRDQAHDLFNGLAWLRFPLTKRRLNELQAEEIAARGIASTRGALRDALTLFDENAAVLQAPASLVHALRRRDWNATFLEHRELWRSANLILFGHALMEKLMQPRKAITAHVWIVESVSDEALAASLTVERLATKPFLPLPILGVPGWWEANEEAGFYDDAAVFRPAPATTR
jgi:hypothetical protein